MSRFWQHFITNGGETPAGDPPPRRRRRDDAEALDAFSHVVVHVADALRPAVVNLRGERAAAAAAPASCSRPTASC